MTLILIAIGLLRSTSQPADTQSPPNALALVSPLLQPSIVPLQPIGNAPDTVDALLNRPLHPGAPASGTLNQRLSVDQSIDRVQQIDHSLASLHQLTQKQAAASNQPSAESNKDLATQTLTLQKRLSTVTGTLKKQDYEIKKLAFELAQKQFQDGEIPQTRLDQQQATYQKSARELKTFLNSSKIAD